MKSSINGINILGIASVLPPDIFDISSMGHFLGEKRVNRIMKSTGIKSVHFVKDGVTASDLCISAARELFSQLNIDKDTIDAVVFVSISPDYRTPATSAIIQHKLGLSKDVVAFDINYGCSAFVYGLYQATMLIKAGGCKRVLLCNGDIQSKLINPKDTSMKMIVGDAGTATIVEKGNDTLHFVFKTDGSGYESLIIPAGGVKIPYSDATKEVFVDDDGNERTKNDLYMNGMEIMRFALTEVPEVIEQLLAYAVLKKEDVGIFAFHQPNKLILDYLKNQIGIKDGAMPIALENTGNTASASIPLMLTEKNEELEKTKLEKVVACGFGVGLSVAAATLNLSKTNILKTVIYR